jgi:serine/threonine protein kinase
MIKIIGKGMNSLFVIIISQNLGNFGTVYLYQHKNAPHDVVAVKEITNLIEMKLISQCQHPNVVEYFGYFLKQGMYYIVMEYMDGRDFHNYLINTHNVSVK